MIRKKGRPPVPLALHSNPTMKLHWFENQIDKCICNKKESTELLRQYYGSKLWKQKQPESDVSSEKALLHANIGANICMAFNNEVPKHSTIRATLMQIASRNIPVSKLQTVIDCSRVTLTKYKNMKWNEVMKKNCNASFMQERISKEEIDEIRAFLLECCPVKSGEPRSIKISSTERMPRHTQQMSDDALYQLYVARFTALVSRIYIC